MIMRTIYGVILEGVTEDYAKDYLHGFDFSECETETAEMPKYHHFVAEYRGVLMYYDFGADYYFFIEDEED